jgi:hypothetical protein
MRPSCLNCARKHLAQAEILLHESKQGYPDHFWLCMGHLAEAADELLRDHQNLADQIRNERKLLEDDPEYQIPIMDLIAAVSEVAGEESNEQK